MDSNLLPIDLNLFYFLDLLGTAAFAISGALAAMDRRLDLFGIFIIAFVTAIGGGTLRDTLIGSTPVMWMDHLIYVYLIGAVTVFSIIFRNKLNHYKKSLLLFDTVGLAVFSITGVETGIQFGLHPLISVTLGAMTGTFGGVIRDILCNEIPVIFHKEIYATASLSGGLFFVLLNHWNVPSDIIYISTTSLIICIRLLAVRYDIRLPSFYLRSEED